MDKIESISFILTDEHTHVVIIKEVVIKKLKRKYVRHRT